MRPLSLVSVVVAAIAALAGPAAAQCPSLPTLYAQNNWGSPAGQIFFDVNVLTSTLTVTAIDLNCNAVVGTPVDIEVYEIPGTYLGQESNFGAWTLKSSGSGTCAGTNLPTPIDCTDFQLGSGAHGFSIVMVSPTSHTYTNGTGVNQFYSNADLSISCGAAMNVPWSGAPFTPRVWNGEIHYCTSAPTPTVYCTAGTSSAGCLPSIAANANPVVAHNAPCSLTVSGLDGQRSGIFFYGLTSLIQPWCTSGGGTSFLCVKAPTGRTGAQSTGGTFSQCDGSMALDWNAFQLANPGSLGNPWTAGSKAYVQAWYRDPPSCKTTGLTDAVELTYLP
jgi:hypothetical protein